MNEVVKQGFAISNATAANKLYQRAWQRVAELGWYVPLCNSPVVTAAGKGIGGWKVPTGGTSPTPLDLFPL